MKIKLTMSEWVNFDADGSVEFLIDSKYVEAIRTYGFENISYKLVRKYIRLVCLGEFDHILLQQIFGSVIESEITCMRN